jgi:hypothetical protein
MLLKEVRKAFKDAGYKLKVNSLSFGKHVTIQNLNGERMPSIFVSQVERNEWLPAINLKNEVSDVTDNNEKVYGFGVDK